MPRIILQHRDSVEHDAQYAVLLMVALVVTFLLAPVGEEKSTCAGEPDVAGMSEEEAGVTPSGDERSIRYY